MSLGGGRKREKTLTEAKAGSKLFVESQERISSVSDANGVWGGSVWWLRPKIRSSSGARGVQRTRDALRFCRVLRTGYIHRWACLFLSGWGGWAKSEAIPATRFHDETRWCIGGLRVSGKMGKTLVNDELNEERANQKPQTTRLSLRWGALRVQHIP